MAVRPWPPRFLSSSQGVSQLNTDLLKMLDLERWLLVCAFLCPVFARSIQQLGSSQGASVVILLREPCLRTARSVPLLQSLGEARQCAGASEFAKKHVSVMGFDPSFGLTVARNIPSKNAESSHTRPKKSQMMIVDPLPGTRRKIQSS